MLPFKVPWLYSPMCCASPLASRALRSHTPADYTGSLDLLTTSPTFCKIRRCGKSINQNNNSPTYKLWDSLYCRLAYGESVSRSTNKIFWQDGRSGSALLWFLALAFPSSLTMEAHIQFHLAENVCNNTQGKQRSCVTSEASRNCSCPVQANYIPTTKHFKKN